MARLPTRKENLANGLYTVLPVCKIFKRAVGEARTQKKHKSMNLQILGRQIKEARTERGISLNKMSNDLYGSRGRVNHLSNIEKGKVDLRFSQVILIFGYLNISFWGTK